MRMFISSSGSRSNCGRHDDPGASGRRRSRRRRSPARRPRPRIEATQRRHPAMASVARGVRHRLFDRPLVDRHRDEVATAMRQHVLALTGADGGSPQAATHEAALIACTLPLTPVFKRGRPVRRDGARRGAAQRADAALLQDPRPRSSDDRAASTGSTSPRQHWRHDRAVAVLSVGSSTDDLRERCRPWRRRRRHGATGHGGRRPVPDGPLGGSPDRRRACRCAHGEARRAAAAGDPPCRRHRRAPRLRQAALPFTFRRPDEDGRGPYWMPAAVQPASSASPRRKFRVPPPDDLQTAAHVATVQLRDRSTPVDRRRLRLRLRCRNNPADRRSSPSPRSADDAAGDEAAGRWRSPKSSWPWPAASTPSAGTGRRSTAGEARLEPGDAACPPSSTSRSTRSTTSPAG